MAALLAHLVSGIDRASTDEDFGNMVLSQAQVVVPHIQGYRDGTASRRDSPPVDHTMIASLQRPIERLLQERRLRLANKLIDKLLGLQGGSTCRLRRFAPRWLSSFSPRAQEIPSVTLKSSWPRRPNPLAFPPSIISTVLRTLNRGSGSGVTGLTNAFILEVFTSSQVMRRLANPGRIASQPCATRC